MPANYRKKAPLFPVTFPPQSRDGACDTVYSDPLTQKPQYNTCERKRGSVRSDTNRHCRGRPCTGNRPFQCRDGGGRADVRCCENWLALPTFPALSNALLSHDSIRLSRYRSKVGLVMIRRTTSSKKVARASEIYEQLIQVSLGSCSAEQLLLRHLQNRSALRFRGQHRQCKVLEPLTLNGSQQRIQLPASVHERRPYFSS